MATARNEKPLRTLLVTGCSEGGIGSALAKELHDRGFHVFATARSASKMAHLSNLSQTTLLGLDVESQSSIEEALKTVVGSTAGTRRLDYLVYNAGLNLNYPALDTDLEYAKKVFDVNFWGMVHMTKTFTPLLIESNGTVVNNASLAGVLNVPWGCTDPPPMRPLNNFS
jgi:NADP-dependent 3-hydroxy acid dehydrogenase YdfG